MTTTPQPEAETPTRPQITLETGRYYAAGVINWMTTEVVAAANCPSDRTPNLFSVGFSEAYESRHQLYGLHINAGVMSGYPIKPGAYPVAVHMSFDLKDPDSESSTANAGSVACDLIITGQPLGTEYDREVLHHLHPGIPALFANTESIKEAMDSQWLRITSIERQIAEDSG